MLTIGKECKTKRGNRYHVRCTRVATGYSKVLADTRKRYLEHDEKYKIILALAVRGTLDETASLRFRTKVVTKHHPQDPSYTKKVIVLNDSGRQRLKALQFRRKYRRLNGWLKEHDILCTSTNE